jgi:hypothetical protein
MVRWVTDGANGQAGVGDAVRGGDEAEAKQERARKHGQKKTIRNARA